MGGVVSGFDSIKAIFNGDFENVLVYLLMTEIMHGMVAVLVSNTTHFSIYTVTVVYEKTVDGDRLVEKASYVVFLPIGAHLAWFEDDGIK